MSSPFPGAASETSGGDDGSLSGFEIVDPELAVSVRDGIARVEELLHTAVHSDFEFVTRASLHLVDAGGKRFRPLFTLLSAHLGEPERENVTKSAAVIELVHLATLYHDDVMDEATVRRGATSANARWDNSIAILTGDYLFAQASRVVADLGTDAAREMAQTFESLVTGQLRETVGVGAGEDPVEHYLRVVDEKTASLIAIAGRFGALFAGVEPPQVEAMERFGRIVGIVFQISDDIIDIASAATESGKAPGTDLREGVRTLPMLHALADPGTDPRLRELLSAPLEAADEVEEALALLRESDGMARARSTLDDYADEARKELVTLPECPARDALAALIDYVIARSR